MNTPSEFFALLSQQPLIAVIRAETPDDAIFAAKTLIEGGLRHIEVTWTVPDAAHVLETLSDAYPEAVLGAGTILEIATAVKALASGARFLVSPVTSPELLQFTQTEAVPFFPGATTPAEIFALATRLGRSCDEIISQRWVASSGHNNHIANSMIKVFPTGPLGGPAYLKAIKGPFPGIPLLASGGTQPAEVGALLKAGASAVSLGSLVVSQSQPDARQTMFERLHVALNQLPLSVSGA